jgi:hypothetical protein
MSPPPTRGGGRLLKWRWGVVGWVGGWRVVVGSAWGSRKWKRENEEGHACVSQTKSLLVSDLCGWWCTAPLPSWAWFFVV